MKMEESPEWFQSCQSFTVVAADTRKNLKGKFWNGENTTRNFSTVLHRDIEIYLDNLL